MLLRDQGPIFLFLKTWKNVSPKSTTFLDECNTSACQNVHSYLHIIKKENVCRVKQILILPCGSDTYGTGEETAECPTQPNSIYDFGWITSFIDVPLFGKHSGVGLDQFWCPFGSQSKNVWFNGISTPLINSTTLANRWTSVGQSIPSLGPSFSSVKGRWKFTHL